MDSFFSSLFNLFRKRSISSFFGDKSKKFNFIGWIPNTTGHVYFRHATDRQGDVDRYVARPPVFQDKDANETRYILATSLCDLNDLKPKGNQAKFTRIIVSARSKNKKELNGRLWMIWDKSGKPATSYFEQKIITLFVELEKQSEILRNLWTVETGTIPYSNDILFEIDENDDQLRYQKIVDVIKRFEKSRDELESLLKITFNDTNYPDSLTEEINYLVSSFDFTVSNTGFCYLKHSELSADNINSRDEIELAYYYLKYLLHTHSHHHKNLDSICRLHEIKSKNPHPYVDSRIELCQKILRDIKVNLLEIKFKKIGKESFIRNTKGLAAYGTSLIQQLKSEKILDVNDPEHVDFVNRESIYIESLINSTDIKQKEKDASSWRNIFTLFNYIFAFTIILIGSLTLFGVEIAKLAISTNDNIINCINEQNYPTDFLGKFVAELICNNGITVVVGIYVVIMFVSLSIAYYYIYLAEKGFSRSFLLTTLIKDVIKPHFLRPKKITSPLPPSNTDENYNRKIFLYNLNSLRYRFGNFRLFHLPSFISGTYYWDMKKNTPLRIIFYYALFALLIILATCGILILGILVWTALANLHLLTDDRPFTQIFYIVFKEFIESIKGFF